MRIAEVLLLDFDTEMENTRRTLERLPETLDPEWAPHEKSMKVGKLAMHCATIAMFGHYILEDDAMDMAAPKRPHMSLVWQGREHALAALAESSGKLRASLESASDEDMAHVWRFSFGEHVIANAPRAEVYRTMCFDHMIHHVAQLGVYLRLLGIAVPGLYGPSADEPFLPK